MKFYGLRGERSIAEIVKENLSDEEILNLVENGSIPEDWENSVPNMYELGDSPARSIEFYQGSPTNRRLFGTSAIETSPATVELDMKKVRGYASDVVYLLESDEVSRGEDAGEIIMIDPIVVRILNFY